LQGRNKKPSRHNILGQISNAIHRLINDYIKICIRI
jgi:hypothetical protein